MSGGWSFARGARRAVGAAALAAMIAVITAVIGAVVVAAAGIAGCGRSGKPTVARDAGGGSGAIIDASMRIDAAPVREVVILRQVLVDVVAPASGHAPAKDVAIARLRRLGDGAVDDASRVPAGWAGRGGSVRAVITYDLGGTDRAPTVLMTVEATLELDGDALGAAARAAGEQPIGRVPRADAVDELATTLVDQVATELTNKLTVRAGTAADLATAAKDTDPETAAWALELAGERGDPRLRELAIEALGKPPRLRTAAIQYLVALGDPSAVRELTASVDFAEPEELAAIIEAVTSLGGEDARDFLELLASGSTDIGLATRARQGLQRLDKKEDAGL